MNSARLTERMPMRSPRAKPRLASARATPFAIASSCAYVNSRGTCSPPRSMIATLLRSSSRRTRSPRLVKPGISSASALGRGGEIGPAAAGEKLALRVEHVRLRGRELAAHAHHLAADREIAGHGGGVIIDAHSDGRHAAAELLHHRRIGAEIDQRRQHAAVRIAALDVDHPFLAPGGLDLDAVVVQCDYFQPQPLVIGGAGDQLLHALDGNLLARLSTRLLAHGATTTLPMTSRSWISRSPSRASDSGSTLSITGAILPSAISFISACRSSS